MALQLLFQRDQNANPMTPAAARSFAKDRLGKDLDAVSFCLSLADGVELARRAIDALLSATAENWRLHRMTPVDRNVLRLGAYELKFATEPTPPAVAIDEAVELARRYGSEDSPAFVNGILDKIAKAT